MALPSSQSGGSGRSRSEAAIEAWKHRQRAAPKTTGGLSPAIAARVKEILAAKQKKGKPRGGKAKVAKPKDARTPQEKANQNRAGVAKQTGMGDLEGTLVRLNAGKQGAGMENDKHDALIKNGLAERHADGSVSLSPAGKKWKAAADKGDKDAASGALADAKAGAADRAAKEQEKGAKQAARETAKADREKVKAAKLTERVAKQKKQQQAQKHKAQARKKIAAEKAKANAAKDAAQALPAPAIKAQSDEERAMFAKMGGGRGAGRGYNKRKSTLNKNRGESKPAGGGGSSSSASATTEGHSGSAASGGSGGGPGGRATLKPAVSGDMEAHARFVADKRAAQAARAERRADTAAQRNKAKANIAKIDAIQKELKKRSIPIARLRELQQQLSDIRSGKALDMDNLLAIKAGARHSRTDLQHIQAIHDSAVACGADCDTGDEADTMPNDEEQEGVKAIKGIMDDPGYYAQHECGDIMQAANALSTMAMLIQSELAEEDEDTEHITMLCDAAHTLVDFIDSELDELEQAAKDDAAEDATIGNGPMKAIAAREDVNPKAGVAEYGKVDFADAKNKKYPIDTEAHVRAALNYFSKDENKAKYSAEDQSAIMAKIVAAWKKLIDKAGPPSAGKAIDDAWLHIDGSAIKALDNDVIRGYAVRFGDADHADLQHDYYTKATDFWLDHFGWPRPITYHHGMDAGTRNDPVIGHWLKAGVDDVGVWMEGQMDRAHAYYKAMKELAQRGYLRLSSDSAPQWVVREKQQNGVNEIKRWPLVTSSVTVTPMEPRMLPVEVKAYLAEIGVDIDMDAQVDDPDDAKADGQKATDNDRARAILLELDLLELETA